MTGLVMGAFITALLAGTPADSVEPWAALFGPQSVRIVSGNGGLTAGWDHMGRAVSCRWPSPGYFDQLSVPGSREAGSESGSGGLAWGLILGDRVHCLSEDGWECTLSRSGEGFPMFTMESANAALGVRAKQDVFVHARDDILCWRVEIAGADKAPRVVFLADLTPCTRLIPEAPLADWALDSLNDFAAFADPEQALVCHFRPRNPGMREWARAQEAVASGAPPKQWAKFSEGVWAVYGSTNPVSRMACMDADSSDLNALVMQKDAPRAAAGQCVSFIEPEPARVASGWQAVIFLSFGTTHAEAVALLDSARERGFDRLLQETADAWSQRLAAPALAANGALAPPPDMKAALADLFVAMDRDSGAMVRAPVTQPPLALDWPRHGVWLGHALDLAGYHAEAERHLLFYLGCVRDDAPHAPPAGSLPAALYADTRPALPEAILERDAAAWLLTAVWRHGLFLDAAARNAFLDKAWPNLQRAAAFLSHWTVDRDGRPLPSYQARFSRDVVATESLLLCYAGLESAALAAERLDRPLTPSVRRAIQEVQAAVQVQFYGLQAPWTWPDGLAYWIDAAIPPEHWLRKPIRVGAGSWTPMAGADRVPAEWNTAPETPDALAAARKVIAAFAGGDF